MSIHLILVPSRLGTRPPPVFLGSGSVAIPWSTRRRRRPSRVDRIVGRPDIYPSGPSWNPRLASGLWRSPKISWQLQTFLEVSKNFLDDFKHLWRSPKISIVTSNILGGLQKFP